MRPPLGAAWCARTLALAILLLWPLRADDTDTPPTGPAVTDPALVARHYQQVVAAPQYYDANDGSTRLRLQDLFSEWFQGLGRRIGDFKYASSMPAFESMLMAILVALSFAVVIYVLLRIARVRTWSWRETEPLVLPKLKQRPPEFYDEEIAQAVQAGDWHRAWLAVWRQFLSRLERRRLVDADRTRTNREYLGQLRTQPLPASALPLLLTLVDAYDRSIYGRGIIGQAEWRQFHQQIEEAALLLHLDDKRNPAPGAVT